MKKELADYLNGETEQLKARQRLEIAAKKRNILGRQYGYRSSALRAIRRFKVKYFVSIPKGFQFWVNRIDEGCHEIEGCKR